MSLTLTLDEAANFLKMSPEALRQKAKAGKIPGAKVGKCWVFYEPDLVEYLRSLYAAPRQASQSGEEAACHHSIDVIKSGGSDLRHQTDGEYANLLGLPTEKKPKSSTTRSRRNSGRSNGSENNPNGRGNRQSCAG